MRASLCLILSLVLLDVTAQSHKRDLVNGFYDNVPLELILDSLSEQTGYFFSYNSDLLPQGSLYTISANNTPIDQFLSRLLVGTGLKYSFYKDQVILNYETPVQARSKRSDFFTISGKVVDDQGAPLHNANIFLDGTTIGATSDLDGNYKLESIPPGLYDVVFSYVGYETHAYHISENNGGARIQNHRMELNLNQLNEVEVISNRIQKDENSWITYYSIFKKELLGNSKNAQQCVIENPQDLDFSFDPVTQTLRAFSQEAIQIRNDALGYKISYFLELFAKKNIDLRFRGNIRFRNLEPLNGKEKREWKKNRKNSYYGSINHFKKALLEGNLKKEGFRIYHIKSLKDFSLSKEKEITSEDIIVFKGDHYELQFKNYLAVEYRKEKESEEFLTQSESVNIIHKEHIKGGVLLKDPSNQISAIKLLKPSVRLDLTGETLDRFGITTFGYWSWERTADLVPINYDPSIDDL